MQTSIQHPILVVEDSPDDFYATRRGLQDAGLGADLIHCRTGEDTVDYLFHQGRYAGDPAVVAPEMILLDLNLPGLSGLEVLTKIKNDVLLRRIPVIVLSTSGDPQDVDRSYVAGANSYVRKPMRRQEFERAMQSVKDFWFGVSLLPEARQY